MARHLALFAGAVTRRSVVVVDHVGRGASRGEAQRFRIERAAGMPPGLFQQAACQRRSGRGRTTVDRVSVSRRADYPRELRRTKHRDHRTEFQHRFTERCRCRWDCRGAERGSANGVAAWSEGRRFRGVGGVTVGLWAERGSAMGCTVELA